MRTTKPIATISFNTPHFLRLKLEELTKGGKISFWAYICHKPEDDEGGKKEHIHLYIEPSKMIQTDDLRLALVEFTPERPDKPLGTISFNSSKFDHWYLYALHDRRYLASKGQSRKYHYTHDEIVTSDADDLLYKARSIDMMSLSPYADMEDAISHGITFEEYFGRGTIPIQQLALFERAWHFLVDIHTNRGGREGHPNDIDEVEVDENGEVIETPPDNSVEPTWCDATRKEWSELYDSATND